MAHPLRLLTVAFYLFPITGISAQQLLDCTLPHQPNIDISVRTAWATPRWKNLNLTIPITANLNPQTDSIPEILVLYDNVSSVMKMVIFRGDGLNAAQPDTLLLPGGSDYSNTPAVGDIDADGIPEVIYTAWDRYIRVLRHYTPGANPPMSLWLTSDAKTRTSGFRPTLADLDGDGTPEIVAGDEVFIFDFSNPAAPLLRKVLDANGKNGESVTTFTPHQNAVAAADILSPADCGGDPDCNGLEIAAGPVIYSVDLDTTDGDGFQIKVQRNLNTPSQPDQYSDGYTAVADLNLDGTPDIAVSGVVDQGTPVQRFGVYVWNKNGLIKFMPRPDSLTNVSSYFDNNFPTIANVFDDRKLGQAKDYPEIISSGNQFLICQNLHAFAYPNYSAWWFLPTDNTLSWGGSATAFDFNADGYAELTFVDGQNLRILYGGAVPFPPGVDANRNWATIPGAVGDRDTYPVIADVDNDGETEIAALVRDQFILSQDTSGMQLIVLESAGLPWPPSRPVWNQHTYNVVNVNDDLSIPAVPKQQWQELPAAGSGIRPFNMFLGQVPLLGPNGQPVIPLPDASASVDSAGCNQNQLLLHLQICNPGDAKLPAGSAIQFYLGNPTTTAAPKFGAPQPIPVAVPAGQCVQWTASLPMPPDGILWGVVNDNGSKAAPFNLATAFPSTGQIECNYANNLFFATIAFAAPALDLGPDRMACSNVVSTLHAGPGFAKYQWPDGSADSIFAAAGPGKYWVNAWDRCGNLLSDTVNIAAFPTPSIDLGADRSICAGDSIILNLPGFDELSWTTAAGPVCANCPSMTLHPLSGLTIWVAGKSGVCTLRDTLNLDVAPVPQLSGQTTATTCGRSNGTISIQISQGTAPYQTQWTGGLSGTQASQLPAGLYAVTVTDAKGCQAFAALPVGPSDSLQFYAPELTPARCFGEANGQFEANMAGGQPPYQFNWSTGPGTSTLTNLAAGLYEVTVIDAAGCSATAQFAIPEPPELLLQATIDSTSCTSTTGGIAVAPVGGMGGYSYAWNTGYTTPALDNLQPGVYTVTVTDINGCSTQQAFAIAPGGSPVLASPVLSPVRCFGEANGKIEINASGDAAPFVFNWSTGPGGNSLSNLGAGNYGLTVTGANGCTTSAQFSISEPPLLAMLAAVDPTSCSSTTGGISLTAAGGTPGYAYAWSSGQTAPTLSNLPAGNYTVTLSDANACTVQQSFQIAPGGSPVLASPVLSPVRCFGEANGKIEINASGDAAPFVFNWSTGPGGNSLSNLGAGNYGLTVTGANGCTTSAQFNIPESPLLGLQAIVDPTSCSSTTGGISVTGQGGTPGYVYAWSSGQTAPTLSNLPPGDYTVTLSDANACTVQQSFQIAPGGSPVLASPVLSPVRCFGEANGKIEINASGGAAPFSYNWSTGPGNAILSNLKAGAYALTVSDANGCSSTAQFVLDEPAALSVSLQPTPIPCAGATGSLSASAQGGTGAYAYAWENGSTAPQRSGLPAGVYALTATDARGCTAAESIDLIEPAPLGQTATVDSVTCQAAGSIALAPQGGTPPYAFAWSNGASSALNNGLAAGVYTITLTDANGCSRVESFMLAAGDVPAIADAMLTPARCFGENNGQIQLKVGNGQPPYQFLWSNNGSANPLAGLAAGTYTVTVTDAKNCILSAQFSIGQPDLLQPAIVSIAADTCGRHTGSIDLGVSGGTGPYQFAWSNGYSGEDPTQAAAGAWSLTLTDANGCTAVQSADVPAVNPMPVFALSGGTITCATPAVTIAVNPAATDWTIRWQTPGGGILSGAAQQVSAAGNYPVTVTNAAGCSVVQLVLVPANTAVPKALAAADSIFIPCGQAAALLDGSASGSGPQIEAHWYRLDNGQWTADTLAYAIAADEAGFYLLKVLDQDNGCAGYDTVEVVRAPGIDAVLWDVDSISCFGLDDGGIRVEQVLGGTPPYRYSIDLQTFVDAPFFEQLPPGAYTLAVKDAAGCHWQTAVALTEPDSFGVTLQASDTLLNPGQVLRLKAGIAPPGKAIAFIEWSPAELFGTTQQFEQWLAPEESTLFGVRVTDDRGCTAEAAISVKVAKIGLYLPTAIRPGGLPGNDVFTVNAGADVRRVRLLRVFDRWGELLFERQDFPPNDPANGWDGRYRGQPAAPGVYVYHLIAELADGSEVPLTGDVTVLY